MFQNLRELLKLYQFPTGRRLFVFKRMLKAAQKWELIEVEKSVLAAIKQDRETHDQESYWRSGRKPKHGPEARGMKAELDKLLSGFDKLLEGQMTYFGDGEPIGVMAEKLREILFPQGVRAVTRRPYVEEYEMVETKLERIGEDEELFVGLSELGLSRHFAVLSKFNKDFGKVIGVRRPDELTYEKLRSLHDRGQENLARIVFYIIGHTLMCCEDAGEIFEDFLWPIWEQNQDIGTSYQDRRTVLDLDPETEELVKFEVEDSEDDPAEDAVEAPEIAGELEGLSLVFPVEDEDEKSGEAA